MSYSADGTPPSSDDMLHQWEADRRMFGSDPSGSFADLRDFLHRVASREAPADLLAKIDASDLAQDAFQIAFEQMPRCQSKTYPGLKAWARQILMRRLLNHVRHFRRTQKAAVSREVSLDGPGGPGSLRDILLGDDSSPSQGAIRHESVALLRERLARLPERDRQVLLWREEDDESFAQIGQRLGISAVGAQKAYNRALGRLRSLILDSDAPRSH